MADFAAPTRGVTRVNVTVGRRSHLTLPGGLRHGRSRHACSVAAYPARPAGQAPLTTPAVVLFEGARLVTGDGGTPIENSAFLVENRRFTFVGKKGEVPLPRGGVRVDLTGKTVMPALVELHGHLGYWKGLNNLVENFTRENLIDHLQRFAYHGVAAVVSLGTDRRELVIRSERAPPDRIPTPRSISPPGKHPPGRRTVCP